MPNENLTLSDIKLAEKSLIGHSIALVKDGVVLVNDKRGVTPMLEYISSKTEIGRASCRERV